ncbi:uncharacterized mitochondrial protein AtMg00240-like [Amaranthus tricolor]|uniref:uncharacterized mitochondrial protein AtMg00240-like n=1 Tax=Amaranthus tricolor TaxID=29722 RepID=UPI0025865288|nr:uncharacterized mitochondrial protein AtMg00240-like [Amaranthus tricolor]
MEISDISNDMVLTQHKFTKELLKDSGLTKFKRAVTPLPLNIMLSASEGTLLEDPTLFKSIVRKLNFLIKTRPDLSYTVKTLSQFMQSLRTSHWQALTHILNYVHNTCGQEIILKGEDQLTLQAFSDSDWISITGYLLLL